MWQHLLTWNNSFHHPLAGVQDSSNNMSSSIGIQLESLSVEKVSVECCCTLLFQICCLWPFCSIASSLIIRDMSSNTYLISVHFYAWHLLLGKRIKFNQRSLPWASGPLCQFLIMLLTSTSRRSTTELGWFHWIRVAGFCSLRPVPLFWRRVSRPRVQWYLGVGETRRLERIRRKDVPRYFS